MKTKTLSKEQRQELRGLLLCKSGLTASSIGETFKVSRQFVHQVLFGGQHNSQIAKDIRKYAASHAKVPPGRYWVEN